MQSLTAKLLSTTAVAVMMSAGAIVGGATVAPEPASAASNPCNPCAAKNPCNPCAAKNPCNPCAAKNPCNPCAAKNPCNPCAAANPCNPCAASAAATGCEVPRLVTAALANPCAAKNPCNPCAAKAACNPCNPCAAKAANPCNPCAAKNPCNPCAAKAASNPCNPCAAKNPCNPCAAKNPCNPCAAKNPCNPCAAKNPCAAANPCNPCNPCGAGAIPELTDAEAAAAYDCVKGILKAGYAKSGLETAKFYQDWERFSRVSYQSQTHGSRYVQNYANATGKNYGKYEQAGPMKVGAVLAKDSFVVSPDGKVGAGPLFLMQKMAAGFNEASQNWRYTLVMPDGNVVGTTNGNGSDAVAFCIECHVNLSDVDSMLFMPDAYRVGGD